MTRRPGLLRAVTVGVAALAALAATAVTAAPAGATVTATRTFVGYGYLPSDAHTAAVNQMTAYSPSCREVGTTYSPAGSEHYWKATLTADC
ncbi:hypothetical protein ACH495_11800 [Micromonospora sp. NPDC018662]|uniref:hypothetical protein n=1 Tax=Micromonospora sp. NPDC018662 TaxID=3364238 RepID=UPI0037A44BE6